MEVPRLYVLERLRGRRAFRTGIAIVYLLAALAYLVWRATVFNPDAPVFSLIFYIAEVFGFILAIFMILMSWRYRVRNTRPAPPGLSVDIFVPTYNEDADMIRRTILAAMQIGYKHETWLLDDGNRPEIKAIADELGCRYIAREKNIHAKPGNLNNALKYARGDFIAIMDADFVAQRNFLDRMLGYFSDPNIAFVQCPQDYYNIRAFQYRVGGKDRFLWHDEAPFYYVLQPGRDYWNAASSCGTSVVYRRSAIDAVGGFAPETVTEDMHTALRLHIAGFDSAYHPEPLAYGVAPTDFAEYQKTRHRWGQGNVQGLRCERMPFAPNLTLMQRICYMQFGIMYLEGWQRLILYLTPAITLIGNIYPVTTTPSFFWFFVPYLLLDYICYEETMRGYGRVYLNEQLCMARFPIYIMSCFAVFFNYVRWRVSSKKIVGSLPVYLVLPQLAVLLINLAAVTYGVRRILSEETPLVPRWIIAIVCLFAFGYAVVAGIVIWHATRCARYKRPDFRFDVPLPVAIDSEPGKPHYGIASETSILGMRFSLGERWRPAPDGRVKGRIFLPNGVLRFDALVDPTDAQKDQASLLFEWHGTAADKLDLALHVCGWHRRFSYRGDHLMTPVEWLQAKFGRREVRTTPEWQTAIVKSRYDSGSEGLALYCRATNADGARWLVAYSDYSIGDELLLIDPRKPGDVIYLTVLHRGDRPGNVDVELDGAVPMTFLAAVSEAVADRPAVPLVAAE